MTETTSRTRERNGTVKEMRAVKEGDKKAEAEADTEAVWKR